MIDAFMDDIPALPEEERLPAILRKTADIPWGEGRTVSDVLRSGKGTCTGKHLVLQACLDKLKIPYRPVVCTFRWEQQGIKYPPHLKAMLGRGGWDHGHTFLQIEIEGKYTDVDITWNPRLRPYGFRTFPEDWDGRSPHVGVDDIVRRWDGADAAGVKAGLIDDLDPVTRQRRERFLKGFIEWVEGINGCSSRT